MHKYEFETLLFSSTEMLKFKFHSKNKKQSSIFSMHILKFHFTLITRTCEPKAQMSHVPLHKESSLFHSQYTKCNKL